jgi:hypothetical protein
MLVHHSSLVQLLAGRLLIVLHIGCFLATLAVRPLAQAGQINDLSLLNELMLCMVYRKQHDVSTRVAPL